MEKDRSARVMELLRSLGNACYLRKNYGAAVSYYEEAAKLEPDSALIHLNKADALLHLKKFVSAYREARQALEAGAEKEKAHLRMGQAAYGLRQWEMALKHLKYAARKYPEEVNDDVCRTKVRLLEASQGIYDISQLYDETAKRGKNHLDLADYTGPIQIADMPQKGGKGMVAINDIPKGTLLMGSKALSMSNEQSLVAETVEVLQRNPHRLEDIYSLYAGDSPRDIDIPKDRINVDRISKICLYNSFIVANRLGSSRGVTSGSRFGLWILPSFFNHSCLANAHRTFFGDFMFIYAVHDIKQGEEVTMTYAVPTETYIMRTALISKYGFRCHCRLCKLDRADPLTDKRDKIRDQCFELRDLIQNDPAKAEIELAALIKGLRETYQDRAEFRTQLVSPLISMARVYERLNELEKAAECYVEALDSLGSELRHYSGPEILVNLAQIKMRLGNVNNAKRILDEAMELYQIEMGVDKELFKEIFPVAGMLFNDPVQ
ncbi:SET domain-containing protein [Ditylenchus destructor]|uniref:SET domain-containing protein n=1 Tax=Ditylenchus destructor TaxID=166010 RepID=A0AAD4RA86_9BILA|nr:SET domain-containing protein [Ditylenchus destructor]